MTVTLELTRLIPAHAGKTRQPNRRSSRRWAHPRSRGENSDITVTAVAATGSSPLTRGKQPSLTNPVARSGLIPAHAGKTCGDKSSRWGDTAHPRSRGENVLAIRRAAFHRGSSPLTRGKLQAARHVAAAIRLIPAHAGKTQPCSTPSTTEAAHPRSRGENAPAAPSRLSVGGSSPLTRGKQDEKGVHTMDTRLIPAHAGKTSSPTPARPQPQAHPRSRGEN